jgi:recombination protein RecR
MHRSLDHLIKLCSRLPGLGPRSARRLVLHLIRKREALLQPLIAALAEAERSVRPCSLCGNLDSAEPCGICADPRRDPSQLCVVEEVADLWALERSHLFRGRYHVLGGVLSAVDGVTPAELKIDRLLARAAAEEVEEVILATNATVDGQTTAHYLTERLAACHVRVTRLAQGIPMGGELDYLDDGTLGAALRARKPF